MRSAARVAQHAVGTAGQVGRGREPAGRRLGDRDRRRRQGRARRLHHGHGRQRIARHQRHHVQEAAVRSGQGFHPDHARRQDSRSCSWSIRRLPVHSVAELVAYAKANPGKLSFASGGPGSPHHLYGELLKSMTGIEMTHVPYKGSAPALTDVIAGHVPLLFSDTVPSLPQIREGKVRALGVSTAVRAPSAPDIPTIAEAGVPGFDAAGWGVFSVPAGTPQAVVSKLKAALHAVTGAARRAAADHQARHDPRRRRLAGGAAALHRRRDRALGQGRAAGRAGGDGVATSPHRGHPRACPRVNRGTHMPEDRVVIGVAPHFDRGSTGSRR